MHRASSYKNSPFPPFFPAFPSTHSIQPDNHHQPLSSCNHRQQPSSDLHLHQLHPFSFSQRDTANMPPKTADKKPSASKAPATASKAPEKKDAGKKTAASGDKKKRTKARKETYSSYIYKGELHPNPNPVCHPNRNARRVTLAARCPHFLRRGPSAARHGDGGGAPRNSPRGSTSNQTLRVTTRHDGR